MILEVRSPSCRQSNNSEASRVFPYLPSFWGLLEILGVLCLSGSSLQPLSLLLCDGVFSVCLHVALSSPHMTVPTFPYLWVKQSSNVCLRCYGFPDAVYSFTHVWLFVTPWTIAHQAPQSMEFSWQEYWSGLPFPSPGDLPHPGIEPESSAWHADSLLLNHQGIYLSHSILPNSEKQALLTD